MFLYARVKLATKSIKGDADDLPLKIKRFTTIIKGDILICRSNCQE